MRTEIIQVLGLTILFLTASVWAQDQQIQDQQLKLKGGHQLGEMGHDGRRQRPP